MKTLITSLLISIGCCLFFGHCRGRGNQVESVGPFFKGSVTIVIGNPNDNPSLIKATFNQIKNRIQYLKFSSNQLDDNTYELSVNRVADTATLKTLVAKSIRIEFVELYSISQLEPLFTAIIKDLDEQTTKAGRDSSGMPGLARPRTLPEIINISQPYAFGGGYRLPAELGNIKVKDTAYVNNLLAKEKYQQYAPGSLKFAYGRYSGKHLPGDSMILSLYALKLNSEQPNPYPTGDQIADAKLLNEKSVATKMRVIGFQFNSDGARAWHDMTRKNVGKPIAVYANEMVLTAPVVDGPIDDGSSRINGDFTDLEVWYLLSIMRSGSLYLPVRILASSFSVSK